MSSTSIYIHTHQPSIHAQGIQVRRVIRDDERVRLHLHLYTCKSSLVDNRSMLIVRQISTYYLSYLYLIIFHTYAPRNKARFRLIYEYVGRGTAPRPGPSQVHQNETQSTIDSQRSAAQRNDTRAPALVLALTALTNNVASTIPLPVSGCRLPLRWFISLIVVCG